MIKLEIDLINDSTKKSKTAIFREVNLIQDTLLWYADWFPGMFDLSGNLIYGDSHWDVPSIWNDSLKSSDFKVYVIECDNRIQGYFIIQINNYRGSDEKNCGYVSFLAVAPWNRKSNVRKRMYKNVGKILLVTAAIVAYRYNENAAIELESLPDAEDFYRKQGMLATGQIKNELVQYRLNHITAISLMSELSGKFRRGK